MVAATDFLSPRRDQARSVRTYSITLNVTRVYVSLLFCHSLSFFSFLPLSFFFLFLSISPLFLYHSRVYMCVRFSPSRSVCVTFAACASTKLNAGKARREIYSRGMYTVFIVKRGAFSLLNQ